VHVGLIDDEFGCLDYGGVVEPLTTLVVEGLGWIATATMGGIAEGVADRTFIATVRAVRERLPALAGRAGGGDLARGLRRAQLRALERLILDYREQRPLAQFGGGSDPFSERALTFCRSAEAAPVPNLHLPHDALLLASAHAEFATMAAGASAMEDAVLAELIKVLDGTPLPGGFIDHFRNGGRGTPRFVELFGIYFADQVKADDPFREVLHTGLLLQNAANLAALGDWLAKVETRFGGALARLESGVAENQAGIAAILEEVRNLAAQKGVPVEALRSILERLGEASVQDGDILTRLSAKADEYVALREQLSTLASSTPNAHAALSEGQQFLDNGNMDEARRRFADARAAFRATRQQHARDEAALLAAEAGVDRLQLRYRDAADRYEEAERLVASFDADASFNYLCRRASALGQHGEEFGDNAALAEAISLWRRVVGLRSRVDLPLDWAAAQNNLGIALSTLGKRESGTARLEEAVAACRAALEERTRERVPLDWAATQNNLGNALWIVGERESGTARLEEAVAAFRAALEEHTRERVPLDRAMTLNNLGNALAILGERESGTARLEEAVAAYRAALEERTRERVPLDWAATQNNLGNALRIVGERESGTVRLGEAVAAVRAALEEYTRERVPLDWAMTQNNLGNALAILGERENGTARLKEAVAVYQAVLEEYTRERVPLDWAATQNNLGNALRILGERESGTARLEEAVAALRAALEEHTRERVPLDWAMTQHNLGNALAILGERESGTARLEEAVAVYRAVLQEFTRERVPLNWATTQSNLGDALQILGGRESGTARLEEAVVAYRAALEERTRECVPLHWAITQNNLGEVLRIFGERESGAAWLQEAVESFHCAAEIFAAAGADHYAATARSNLEQTRRLLETRVHGSS
jgi:tetratricopeptide (TPR) repeat protein